MTKDMVDAAVLGQQLISGQRHIFSAQTTFCVRCGLSLLRLMDSNDLDKPCAPLPRRLKALPWGD